MYLAECLQFARDHPVCSFATTEGLQPRVRTFILWYADSEGFWFHTVAFKPVVGQVRRNPLVELCFMAQPEPPEPVRMMRVSGICDIVEDDATKARLYDEHMAMLEHDRREALEPLLVAFRVHSGEIRFWRMENFLMDKETFRVGF